MASSPTPKPSAKHCPPGKPPQGHDMSLDSASAGERPDAHLPPGTPARRVSLLPPAPRAPRALAAVGAAIDWAVVAIGTAMIILVFVNVSLHIVSKDFAWVTELAELLMVWVTFLGGACAARRGAQMTITEFIDMLSGRARRAAD